MPDQHKRPMYAFVIVAIVCSLIVANGVRGQALRGSVQIGTQHVASSFELQRAHPAPPSPGHGYSRGHQQG